MLTSMCLIFNITLMIDFDTLWLIRFLFMFPFSIYTKTKFSKYKTRKSDFHYLVLNFQNDNVPNKID